MKREMLDSTKHIHFVSNLAPHMYMNCDKENQMDILFKLRPC